MKISIVTINLNKREDLKQTLESLQRQQDREFELIVVDGGSNDGSQNLFNDYRELIDTAISESDKGIYDAWNKGIGLCHGDIVALLNAGDEYHPAVISHIRGFYEDNWPAKDGIVLVGKTFLVREGTIVKAIGNRMRKNVLLGIGFAHPAMVVPLTTYKTVGLYEPISIASDAQFILRCIRANVKFEPGTFSVYMDGFGISQRAATKGFSQYVSALEKLGFCSVFVGRFLRIGYTAYRTLSNFGLFGALKSTLANMRHLGIWLMNLILRLAFFCPLRTFVLRCLNFKVDSSSFMSPRVTIYRTGNLAIGKGSVINRGVVLDNREYIKIGAGCSLSYDVRVITAGHDVDSPYFEYVSHSVTIEDHVCIFAGSTVLPGTVLRRGVVVLGGAVISGDTIECGIYGGVPARLIRIRRCIPKHFFSYNRPLAL